MTTERRRPPAPWELEEEPPVEPVGQLPTEPPPIEPIAQPPVVRTEQTEIALRPQIQRELDLIDAQEDLSTEERLQLKDEVSSRYRDILGITQTHMDLVERMGTYPGLPTSELENLSDAQREALLSVQPGQVIEKLYPDDVTEHLFLSGEPESFQERVTGAVTTPIFNIAGVPISATEIVGIGLLAYIAVTGSKSLIDLFGRRIEASKWQKGFEIFRQKNLHPDFAKTKLGKIVENEMQEIYTLYQSGGVKSAQGRLDQLYNSFPQVAPKGGPIVPFTGTGAPPKPPVIPTIPTKPPVTPTGAVPAVKPMITPTVAPTTSPVTPAVPQVTEKVTIVTPKVTLDESEPYVKARIEAVGESIKGDISTVREAKAILGNRGLYANDILRATYMAYSLEDPVGRGGVAKSKVLENLRESLLSEQRFWAEREAVKPTAVAEEITAIPKEGKIIPEIGKPPAVEAVSKPITAPEIPKTLPTIPPPLPPEAVTLGRSENEWTGFMADLQEAQTVADVAFRDDNVRKWINLLPEIHTFVKVLNPSAIANTPAEQSLIVRAVLRDEGYQKTQGVTSFFNELGSQENIFGKVDEKGLIKSGVLKGKTVGDIAQNRSKWERQLTDTQKAWFDRTKVVEDSIVEFLERNGIDVNLLRLEEGGQFATRRVWARVTKSGEVIDTASVGAGPARLGARLPTEKHRTFKTELEAIEAGYRYLPYEEALYLKVSGAYNRVADKKMADWLLTKVPWRTTGAPQDLKLAVESATLKKKHSQQLLAALNRAVRGERVPDVTIQSIGVSYPDQAKRLKDLIPKIQAKEPTASEVQDLTRVAKGLIDTNKGNAQRAINARARARDKALVVGMEESMIQAPAFAGKILTGAEAKETGKILRNAFDPSFSNALAQVNKANAIARFFMLAGDFSPFTIQLLYLMGENPVIYGKAFGGAIRALLDPKFHSKFLLKHKDTIDKHPNLLIAKSGSTEFTEAMARGGWLSGKTALIPQGESYWKTLSLILPRTMGKVGGTVLTPFQRVFEYALDSAGIYMAEAYDHLATTPERTADLDQFINEFRGLTSSARIGVPVQQRQIETAVILAPRYNRAIAGLLFDLGRGGIRGSLARKSLAKGIAALVALSVAISISRGESQEEIIDHQNPNSPDFFTWEVAGQRIGPGSKIRSVIKLFAQSTDNPESLFQLSMDNPALRFVRGNLSPVASSGIDLITGRSYIGDPTRDNMLSFSKEILAGNLLPIWIQTVLMEGGSTEDRTLRGIAEFFGGRAYPEPIWGEVGRLRDKYSQTDYKVKYEELNRGQIDKLRNNHPDLKDLEDKAALEGAERGTEFEQWMFATREQITKQRDDALENAATVLLSGQMSKYDYDKERGYARPYYSGASSVLWLARESLEPYAIKQIEKWMGENQKPEDKALDDYMEYRANLIATADLPKDWDKLEKQSESFLLRYSPSVRTYVITNRNRWIEQLPPNARQVELDRLRGIEDETWWDDYREVNITPQPSTGRGTRPKAPWE